MSVYFRQLLSPNSKLKIDSPKAVSDTKVKESVAAVAFKSIALAQRERNSPLAEVFNGLEDQSATPVEAYKAMTNTIRIQLTEERSGRLTPIEDL